MTSWLSASIIALMLLAVAVSLVLRGSGDAPAAARVQPGVSADPADCTTHQPTPTVSTTPTPLPPWTPYSEKLICNDTGQSVDDLHVIIARQAVNMDAVQFNAAGCQEPSYVYGAPYPPAYLSIDVLWSEPCVDPGDYVTITFTTDCTTPDPNCSVPNVVCFYWTLSGTPVPSESPAPNPPTCPLNTPTPSPTATPAPPTPPCPAGTDPDGKCLPCPTAQSLVAAQPVVLSTCPPTEPPFVDYQGDATCDGTVDAMDALAVLRANVGLAVVMEPPCETFEGDVDCNDSTNAVDALKILRHNVKLEVTQNEPCPDIGTPE